MSKGNFSRSIGGSIGSSAIDTMGGKLNRATGGPVGGYTASKSYGAAGKPAPEYGAANNQPVRTPPPGTKHNEQKMPGKPPNGGRM